MLVIDGKDTYLREFGSEQLADPKYFKWLRDFEVVKNIYRMDYLMPLQFVEVERYVNNLICSKDNCFFGVYFKKNNLFIGTFKVGHIDWRTGIADIGIMIGEKEYWGKGLAKDILNTGCDYAFHYLCMRKLTGGTSSSNLAMCKCFERVGFKKEGVIRKQLLIEGDYFDHVLYGMFKDEFYSKRRN